jgi:glycosyltransferase involved in cell wall biosynthesis
MTSAPAVDINLFVRNGAATIAEVLDCVLTQSWPALRLTVIDNASADATPAIVAAVAAMDRRVRLHRNRMDVGPVLNCQRAFWLGNSDFVMPKTADDLLAPDAVAELMDRMLARPGLAMCHAAGLVFGDDRQVRHVYPPEHRLDAAGPDPLARACHVMRRYTSAPSFWGIYRRAAVDQLAPLPYRPGWDHAVLAELSLYGEISHVEPLLFWRRHGGKDVSLLARGCSEFTQRGLGLDDGLADLFWRLPLIGTAYAHIERFAVARLDAAQRLALMDRVAPIFRSRWMPMMRREAERFAAALPDLLARLADSRGTARLWGERQLREVITAVAALVPEVGLAAERIVIEAAATT